MREPWETSKHEWLLWIDDDILITNPEKGLNTLITKYGEKKHLIIAGDAWKHKNVPINSGIFLINNSPWARSFLKRVWHEGGLRGYVKRGQSLLEQQTMTDLIRENLTDRSKVQILPLGNQLQSFFRSDHYDDPESTKWKPGDFAAHLTGIPNTLRVNLVNELINQGDIPQRKPDINKLGSK